MAQHAVQRRISPRSRILIVGFTLFALLLLFIIVIPDPQYKNRLVNGQAEATVGDPRGENRTFMTFPEWYIVFSAQEYADFVVAGNMPTDFPFFQAIQQYWDIYNQVLQQVGGSTNIDGTTATVLKTIGVSFTIEYGIIGLYENTIGRLGDYINFHHKSIEDHYTDSIAHQYGEFLNHTPWFSFPYRAALLGLWQTYGVDSLSPRGVERRLSFTVGYTLKGVYGRVISYLSQTQYGGAGSTTKLTVHSIDSAVLTRLPVRSVTTSATSTTITLPRYREFLRPLLEVIESGIMPIAIEDNSQIMMSVVASLPAPCTWLETNTLWKFPFVTDSAKARYMLLQKVAGLPQTLFQLESCGLVPEHIFDY